MSLRYKILLIDDEEMALSAMENYLMLVGNYEIHKCADSRLVLDLVQNGDFHLIIMDLTMPYITGKELLKKIEEINPEVPIIVVTGENEVDTAVACMQLGAKDFIAKPILPERLVSSINTILEMQALKREVNSLKNPNHETNLKNPEVFSEIITTNQAMIKLFHYMEVISVTTRPVMILGETGVGKELFAKAIHTLSGRSGPFIAINSAGLEENVFSDTLFGHVKGAFTGADFDRMGLIEKAFGGTIFLDEIGDMGVNLQVKLLRLLQENEFMAIGSDQLKKANVRIIAATNCNLKEMQEKGTFRKDLFYRLTDHQIFIPPLRERKEDISLLIKHFVKLIAKELNINHIQFPKELINCLRAYDFPGNIRELQKIVFDAISQHKNGVVSKELVLQKLNITNSSLQENADLNFTFPSKLPTLKEMNQLLIDEALDRASGNQSTAARLLGITPQALNQKLKRTSK